MSAALRGKLLVATPALVRSQLRPHRRAAARARHRRRRARHRAQPADRDGARRDAPRLGAARDRARRRVRRRPGRARHAHRAGPLAYRRAAAGYRTGRRPARRRRPLARSEPLAPMLTGLRVWTGYAGWAPGQLEEELAQDAWFVVDADGLRRHHGRSERTLALGARSPTGIAGMVLELPRRSGAQLRRAHPVTNPPRAPNRGRTTVTNPALDGYRTPTVADRAGRALPLSVGRYRRSATTRCTAGSSVSTCSSCCRASSSRRCCSRSTCGSES